MAANNKELLIKVRADIQKAIKDLEQISGKVGDTGRRSAQASGQVKGLGNSFNFLRNAVAAYLTLRTVTQTIKLADAYNVLQVRIKTATKDTGDYVKVSEKLFKISQNNGVALQTTVSLFQNLARSAPELEATTDDMLSLSNAVQQLGVISGASNANLQAGLLQFSQALSSGIVRAEELNSLLENIPEVANRIAKGMGLTTGQLRKAVLSGDVLSKDVFQALLKQAPEIAKEFENIPLSVGRAGVQLKNSFSKFLGQLDKATGVTGDLAALLKSASASLDSADIKAFLEILKDIVIIAGSLAAGRLLGPIFLSIAAGALTAARNITIMNTGLGVSRARLIAVGRAATLMRNTLALLGGPAGIIIGAATALTFWASSSDDAEVSTDRLSNRLDALLGDMDALKKGQFEEAIRDGERALEELGKKIDDFSKRATPGGSPISDIDVETLVEMGREYVKLKAKINKVRIELNNLGKEKTKARAKTKKLTKGEIDLAKKIDQTIASLQTQAITFGLSAREASLYKLKIQGASDAQLKIADAALKSIESQREFDKALKQSEDEAKKANLANQEMLQTWRDSAEAVRQLIDPTRVYRQELDKYRVLLNAGKISAEEFAAAQEILKKKIEEAAKKLNEVSVFAQRAAENIQSALGDELTNILEGNFDNIGKSFSRMVTRMIAEAQAAELSKLLLGEGYGKKTDKVGGYIGDIFKFIGFASGGQVNGPGTGTSDSIPARLSAGEYVVRARAVQQYGTGFLDAINAQRFPRDSGIQRSHSPKFNYADGGLALGKSNGGDVNIKMTVITKDAESFKRSEGQLGLRAARQAQRYMRRNG